MRLRVLVFDDDPLIRSLLETVLQGRGYEVASFADPGLCPLHPSPACQCPGGQMCADVIISDMKMLSVRGLDFVESQLDKGCKCRFVALMSGAWSDADRARARQIGCTVFDKPFRVAQVCQWLDGIEQNIDPARTLFDGFRSET